MFKFCLLIGKMLYENEIVFLLLNDMIYLIKNIIMCKIFEGKKCVKDLIINLIVFDVLKLSLIIVYLLVYMLFDIFEI